MRNPKTTSSPTLQRAVVWIFSFTLIATLSLCSSCIQKRPQPKQQEPIDASYEYTQKKLAEQKNMPDLTITATDEDYCKIAFNLVSDSTSELCVIGSNGKGLKSYKCPRIKSEIRVSPNGKKLAFIADSVRIFDIATSTFKNFDIPRGIWNLRWWDNDHFYFKDDKEIFKESIVDGKYERITGPSGGEDSFWGDPVWIPEIQRYIEIEPKKICFYRLDGSRDKCIPDDGNFGRFHITTFKKNGKPCISFSVEVQGKDSSTETHVGYDLQGNRLFSITNLEKLTEGTQGAFIVDPSGKWICYTSSFDPNPSNPQSQEIFYLGRISLSDLKKSQLILTSDKVFQKIACYTE
jgi:hypothetical protein